MEFLLKIGFILCGYAFGALCLWLWLRYHSGASGASDVLYINGCKEWFALNGKVDTHKTVVILNMGDLFPYEGGPRFTAETVYLYNNDKNFVCYWMHQANFPGPVGEGPKTIYIHCHPCDPSMFGSLYRTEFVFAKAFANYTKFADLCEVRYRVEDFKLPNEPRKWQ